MGKQKGAHGEYYHLDHIHAVAYEHSHIKIARLHFELEITIGTIGIHFLSAEAIHAVGEHIPGAALWTFGVQCGLELG